MDALYLSMNIARCVRESIKIYIWFSHVRRRLIEALVRIVDTLENSTIARG